MQSQAAKHGAVFAVIGKFTEKNPVFTRAWDAVAAAVKAQLTPAQLELLGKVTSAEIIAQIRRASVVVVPSLFDEWARTALEALALGRPVITTEEVGAASVVREHQAGLVVPAHDPRALAGAIDAALQPGAPYAENARQVSGQILRDFSASAIAQQVARHLEEIAAPER